MRVLLLVQYYLPNIQSCAKLTRDLGAELVAQGHEVIVAAPDEFLAAKSRVSVENGLTVVRVRSGRFRNAPRPLRAFNEWRLSAVMWRRARRFFQEHPCDLIAHQSPTIFFGSLVRRLKRLWGCRDYLILRDIFPQWSVDAGLLAEGGAVHRFFRHYELMLYETADVIGVITPKSLEYFQEQNLADEFRLEVLYNWAPPNQEVPVTDFRRKLGLDDKIVFFYGGNIGFVQDVDNLLRLAGKLSAEPEVVFVIAGTGSEKERLQRLAREQGLSNVLFHPPVDQQTFLGMVAEFDIGLVTLRRDLATHNFPYKILDYMVCGKPILASVNPGNDLPEMLHEEGRDAGFVCFNGEDEEFCRYALRLARSAELRRTLGDNGRALLASRFSSARAVEQILAHVSGARGGGDGAEI